jgi:hypothetical protein
MIFETEMEKLIAIIILVFISVVFAGGGLLIGYYISKLMFPITPM